jgi:hypothetical protein
MVLALVASRERLRYSACLHDAGLGLFVRALSKWLLNVKTKRSGVVQNIRGDPKTY